MPRPTWFWPLLPKQQWLGYRAETRLPSNFDYYHLTLLIRFPSASVPPCPSLVIGHPSSTNAPCHFNGVRNFALDHTTFNKRGTRRSRFGPTLCLLVGEENEAPGGACQVFALMACWRMNKGSQRTEFGLTHVVCQKCQIRAAPEYETAKTE